MRRLGDRTLRRSDAPQAQRNEELTTQNPTTVYHLCSPFACCAHTSPSQLDPLALARSTQGIDAHLYRSERSSNRRTLHRDAQQTLQRNGNFPTSFLDLLLLLVHFLLLAVGMRQSSPGNALPRFATLCHASPCFITLLLSSSLSPLALCPPFVPSQVAASPGLPDPNRIHDKHEH